VVLCLAGRFLPAMNTSLVIVHHANQYLITDGYENRDGITAIAQGYEAVLRMHRRYGIPANLHLSGTLVEALAWYRPQFLDFVKRLVAERVIALVGGTYSENVMPLFSHEHNRAQLDELFGLYDDLLDCPPRRLTTLWVPERVWAPALTPLVTDPSLRNGGYRYVLLDDRLLFPVENGDGTHPRAMFDSIGPYDDGGHSPPPRLCSHIDPTYMMGGQDLLLLPISARLRYWIPPRRKWHWEILRDLLGHAPPHDRVLVYADDLEKTAGVGGWANDLRSYEALLRWLSQSRTIVFPLLDQWRPREGTSARPVGHGTFYELANAWGAGEDYGRWALGRAWEPYRQMFERAADEVDGTASSKADPGLVDLARKHLLAAAHETAWHDATEFGQRAPAPWSRAVASHSRACLPMCEAARSLYADRKPSVEIYDIDEDGFTEVVLFGPGFFLVLSPRWGGRIIYLFHEGPRAGVMSIGNPTDHWNFQETPNRFMDRPSNHPGALADAGHQHDPYEVGLVAATDSHISVELVNVSASALSGTLKTISWHRSDGLTVCYQLPDGVGELDTTSCLSPDYLTLLRRGGRHVKPLVEDELRGACNGGTSVWIASVPQEFTRIEHASSHPGHGIDVVVKARSSHFHLGIGWSNNVSTRPKAAVPVTGLCLSLARAHQ
jgi:starch synthase